MSDEMVPAQTSDDLQQEVERSRRSAAMLLESFAQKLKAPRAVRNTASGLGRAAGYVQTHRMKEVATTISEEVRRRPVPAIVAAMIAGFLIGRALRSR